MWTRINADGHGFRALLGLESGVVRKVVVIPELGKKG
jgi:hypothetical protein